MFDTWCRRVNFKKTHDDAHYAAALYRYMREYAIKLRDYCIMVSIDDKHRLQIQCNRRSQPTRVNYTFNF